MSTVGEPALVEREPELERLEAALSDAKEGRGSLLLVEGPAGIGKSRLLQAACGRGRAIGLHALQARGGELERDFAYGLVRALFERELAQRNGSARAGLLSGSAALAGPAIEPEAAANGAAPDASVAVHHGLYWLVANLAGDGPLLVAVDDAQWSDGASLEFLSYLAPRVEELPVALIVASRTGAPRAETSGLDRLASTPGAEVVRPRALSADGAGRLLREALGVDLDEAAAKACHGATRGNPFLLRELAAAIKADGLTDGLDPGRVRDLAPDTISRALLVRLARMPAAAGALAKAVAVLGNDAELRDAAGLAGVEADEATEALDVLVAADILAAKRPLNFVHPIVRGAVYADMGPGERASAHAWAAQLLLSWGASPERVASHLLHSEPAGDERATDSLCAAADTALGRGAVEAAVRYLRRARAESQRAAADGGLLVELGRAESLAGEDPQSAIAHLRQGVRKLSDPERRADAWVALSRATMPHLGPVAAAAVLDEALEDLPDIDPERRTRLDVEETTLAITHAETFQAAAARIDARAMVAGSTLAERLVLCNFAYRAGMRGRDRARTLDCARRALADGEVAANEGAASNAFHQAIYVMIFADALDECTTQVETALGKARSGGSPYEIAAAWVMRGAVRYFKGDLVGAEGDARQALAVPGFPPFAAFAYALLGWALVDRGDLDGASGALAASGIDDGLPPIVHLEPLFWARARLRLAQGAHAEALADLREYGERSERVGAHNPGIPWRADAALANLRLGEEGYARELADEHLARSRAWGAPSVVGAALRVHGLVAGGADGIADLREAVAVHAECPARLEHARSLVELGAALRRAGRPRDAREPLREGLELARGCVAPPLAERAHAELVSAGARPRRLQFSGVEALTASERRVAEMAAGGMTNREIAQELYVSVRTVENHLGRVYGKLDISSRRELPPALDQP